MSENKNRVMIKQHEPLRVPSNWKGEDRSLVMQLERILDDIYKRFGRLKMEDLSEELQETIGEAGDLPLAADGTRGGVQIGYSGSGKNYPVQLSDEKMYVNVPWDNTTYSEATSSAYGLVKTGYTASGKNYPVALSSGQMYVNVPWDNTTYNQATSSALGLVKIGYATSGKNYAVQLSSGQMYVNVPWTNVSSTGTFTVTKHSKFSANPTGRYYGKVCVVRIAGNTSTTGSGWKEIATVASGYRPQEETYFAAMTAAGAFYSGKISTGGVISIITLPASTGVYGEIVYIMA